MPETSAALSSFSQTRRLRSHRLQYVRMRSYFSLRMRSYISLRMRSYFSLRMRSVKMIGFAPWRAETCETAKRRPSRDRMDLLMCNGSF